MPGQLIGQDKESDIALIKVDTRELIAAEWGDSESLEVGSLVWARSKVTPVAAPVLPLGTAVSTPEGSPDGVVTPA